MKSINMIVMVVLALAVGGGAFFGGMKYQQSQTPAPMGRQSQGSNFQRSGGGNRPINGDILSLDSNGFTVKLADGSSKIVLVSGTTTVVQSVAATKADLKVGAKVVVFGASNTDGSVTASNVQLNPLTRAGQ